METIETAVALRNPDTGQNLIKLTAREELMMKIAEMKNNNLTQSQLDQANNYCKLFTNRCKAIYGLSDAQLQEFTDEQLIELGGILYDQDQKRVIRHYILFLCIPIIGWMLRLGTWTDGGTYTEQRRNLYRELKIPENKNFFPIKQLRNVLKS